MLMDFDSTENKLEKNQHWIKKHWKVFIVVSIFWCSIFGALFVVLFKLDVIYSSKSGPASIFLNQEPLTPNIAKDAPCIGEMFQDKLGDWKISHYSSVDKDGFYCPRSSSSFPSPDIWYKNQIPKIFDSIEIKYQSKNKDNSTDNPSAFIFSLGESPRILRFYITEKDFQVVGFEKIINGELKREIPGQTLTNPIKDNTEILLKIRSIQKSGNRVTFIFNLNYISNNTGNSMEDNFSYDVDLSDPKPEGEYSKTEFGFATLKGDCIKPISYKICY